MELVQSVAQVKARIAAAALEVGRDPNSITLIAATKTQSSQTIQAAIAAGVTACGENRVQELTAHLDDYAYDGAELHFIGQLQTNKVKFVVGRVDMIQSVDSPRLLEAIEKQAAKCNLVQDILLEVNLAEEETKGGCSLEELYNLVTLCQTCPHIRLRGLMTIPPRSLEPGNNTPFFQKMRRLLVDIREKIGDNISNVDCLSMGMSDDYEDAVRGGATHIRVGTALFGQRG